ncbi:MAG: protein translocase subunit SecF [Gammaproteobacteria bacterium]|nr:protein translocase subunit SecF [Gammaproteobacteria bacterium]MBA3730888.1 protein translocase subunit SecF [Gammaproteobacteria bacterium]
MEFLKKTPTIEFMRYRRVAMWVSLAVLVVSVALFVTRGFNFGIDFTGGTVIEVAYPQAVDLGELREALEGAGFEESIAQHFGTSSEVLIRIPPRAGEKAAELSNHVLEALRANDPDVEMLRVEFVGPQVGEELREQGGLALLYALIGILIYVSMRFEWRFALGAVIALVHDVIFTLAILSISGLSFDLNVLAAVLTIIGYSLNDSIVVFDRIRENFRTIRKRSVVEIVDISINETLARTIMTGVSTLLVLFTLYLLGGEVLAAFSFTLIVGILIGTYSSVYVASTYAVLLGVSKADMMPVRKEGEEVDSRP